MLASDRARSILWLVIALHLGLTLASALFGFMAGSAALITVLFIMVITTMHALGRYTLAEFLVFALIAFVASNFYENLSILTGFPFGDYHYSDRLGVKLFLVPLLIAPSYFAGGYFAWSIAHILLARFRSHPRGGDILFLPVIATFVMVMWDMVMDPIASTILRSWVWEDGGSYFGVPFSNYMGWLLCVFTIFQLFALFIAWRRSAETAQSAQARPIDRGYWLQAIIPFFTMSLAWMLRAVSAGDTVVTDPSGQQWNVRDILQSMALVGLFTMWFVCLLAALLVARAGRDAET